MDSIFLAKAGEIVTCENDHKLYEIAVRTYD